MSGVTYRAGTGVRLSLLGLAAILTILAISADPAEARSRRKRHAAHASSSSSITSDSRYADIVIDANTGATLHSANQDNLRHPASLTKIMTLYLLFERLEAGKIKLDAEMEVSARAASQAPTKLGLRPGQTLEVEDAIKGLVTKSANDAAVVIAEALGGSEDEFAKMMTRKARALGMSKTVYVNASGLPDDGQITTARDQAMLAMAVQERFPQYYRYFSTPSFTYRGHKMRNHNHLLGKVAGVDGIKTGYTRDSGFNLITSLRRGNRHLVAVVLGGPTAGQRDARMVSLLDEYIATASNERTGSKVAEAVDSPTKPVATAARQPATKSSRAEASPVITTAAIPKPQPGSTDPIKPLLVKTLTVKPGNVQTASLGPLSLHPQTTVALREPDAAPGARPGILGVLAVKSAAAAEAPVASRAVARAEIASTQDAKPRSGWMIQVGAFDDEGDAKERLSSAKSKAARLLGEADPFTESVVKGDKRLYRARFAGLEKGQAESACRTLKRNDIACMTIKN